MDKMLIRKTNQQKRNLIKDKKIKDSIICEKLINIIRPYNQIALYISIKNEVDLLKLLNLNKSFYIPKVIDGKNMEMTKYNEILKENKFGCQESICNDYIDPNLLEVILIPLLGFDEFGNRVGYGKGYYDRYLKKTTKALKIGIAYECQKVKEVDFNDNDIKLDMIVTEKNVYSNQR